MIRVAPGASFVARQQFASGLTGTVGVRIRTSTGTEFLARTTAGVAADVTVASTTVYRRSFTAPTTAGQFELVWDDGTNIKTEELVVTSSAADPVTPNGRDLCGLADVLRYIPGYDPDDPGNSDTNDALAELITAESRGIYRDTGREFVAISGADPRTFDLTRAQVARRAREIGDAASVTQVELFDFDGVTSLGVIDAGLYVLLPRVREEWEPFTRLEFPYRPGGVVLLSPGRTIQITGTWGFPSIPEDIVQACAKLVVVRYFADNARAGTDLSDAIDPTFSVSGLTRSALEAVEGYSNGGFA